MEASRDYDYIQCMVYTCTNRTVKMVTDIWIQVFEVPWPDVPVIHDDIHCKRLKGSIGRFTSLKESQVKCRNLNIFRLQELSVEEV